jgi:dienelactone hydrolase
VKLRVAQRIRNLAEAYALLALTALAGSAAAAETKALPLTGLARGVLHEGIRAEPDPTQSYTLYLPTAFDPARRWPLLLVFDPRARGRLGAELFAPAAERWGWIVASSENTRSDGDFEINRRAVNAMFPDLVARLPVDERRIHATGFSGGAIVSWILGQTTGQLAGVIAVGGRPVEGHDRLAPRFAVWIEAGRADFNYLPSLQLEALAAKGERPHRFEVFEGRHEWLPPEDAARAVAWLELDAARRGTAAMPAATTIAELAAAELAHAEAAAAAGDPLLARRRFAAVERDFAGLAGAGGAVATAAARAAAIARTTEYAAAEKDAAWGARFEAAAWERTGEAIGALRLEEPAPLVARLRQMLGLHDLLDRAAGAGPRADAARRALASAHVQLGFYQAEELIAAKQWDRAATSLTIAAEIEPGNPFTWYNLACAEARRGRSAAALAALDRALEAGLPSPASALADPDLASLPRAELERRVGAASSPVTAPP